MSKPKWRILPALALALTLGLLLGLMGFADAVLSLAEGGVYTCAAAPESAGDTGDDTTVIPLHIYLDDRCGGCGVDSPGCGNCEDMVTYHGIIKAQLGDRLYDGSIEYRMLNCRLLANEERYEEAAAAFGVPDELYPWLPTTFIGQPGHGLYLVGEASLQIVGQTLDKLIAGADIQALQAELNARGEGG